MWSIFVCRARCLRLDTLPPLHWFLRAYSGKRTFALTSLVVWIPVFLPMFPLLVSHIHWRRGVHAVVKWVHLLLVKVLLFVLLHREIVSILILVRALRILELVLGLSIWIKLIRLQSLALDFRTLLWWTWPVHHWAAVLALFSIVWSMLALWTRFWNVLVGVWVSRRQMLILATLPIPKLLLGLILWIS